MPKQRSRVSSFTRIGLVLLTIAASQLLAGEPKKAGDSKKKIPEKMDRAILNEDGEAAPVKNTKNSDDPENKPKKFKGKYSDDLLVATESKGDKSEKELIVLVEGLTKLVKIEKPSFKRNELVLSKGAAYLNLAKHYRMKAKTPGQYKKQEDVNLNNAIELARSVEKSPFADVKQKARSLHLIGMSYVFLRNDEASIAAFTSALEMDKTSPVNPRLSIYIAEYLYDKEKYAEALPKYSAYFANLTQEEKALAIYKSAWCFILTKEYANAEKSFLKLIGKKWAGDFATDSVRDLAYTVVSHMKEQEIIDFGKVSFGEKNQALMVDFYTEAYQVMIRESANIDRILLYNEILRLDSRPERKIIIALKRLSTHQRDFASETPYQEMVQISKSINENNILPANDSFKYFSAESETEIKKLIRSHADTISKRVKTSEQITELDISRRLTYILRLHIEWFPDSPSVHQSYVLGLDNCTIIKDIECTLRLSREILKIEQLKNIWGRAQLQLVSSLEIMAKKDEKYKDDYFNELSALVKSQEGSPNWLTLAKKLTVYYVENKKFEEAFPFLDKIHKKENNAENLYRKLYCAYELKNYKEVVTHSKLLPAKGAPFYNEMAVLFRESNIMLAQDSAKTDDFAKYEEHLSEFLKLDPDEAKADIARADYFQRLLNKEEFDKLFKSLSELTPTKKYSEPYKKITQSMLMGMLSHGKARDVYKFLAKDSKLGMFADFNYFWFRALEVTQTPLNKKDHEILLQGNPKERAALIGLLTLSRPDSVIQYYTNYPPSDDKEKRILLLNLQIKEGSKEALFPQKYFDMVQSILPPELLNTKIAPSEKLVGYVEFPEVKWSEKKLEKVMPDAVTRIRAIRSQVLRDVAGKSYIVQKRILNTAMSSENRMVNFFNAAPMPKGLTPENEKAYRDELTSISTEFGDQAGEYQKMLTNIEMKIADSKKDDLAVPANMNDWPRPVGDITKLVEAELAQKNGFGALVILESQRAFEKISDDDYYALRAYSILRTLPNVVITKYVQDELNSAKQEKLVEKWKNMLAAPVSDGKRDISSEKGKANLKDSKQNKKGANDD